MIELTIFEKVMCVLTLIHICMFLNWMNPMFAKGRQDE